MPAMKPDEPAVCRALRPFGVSIFTEMTALANATGAVNLSQGFPDFDGPERIRGLAAEAIRRGPNQYAPTIGVPSLRLAVAAKMKRFYRLDVDADREVTITAGATEGLAASLLGIVEPGDEVILFEPWYDLYPPMIARAGGVPVYVPLERPGFAVPFRDLAAAITPRTRAIMINNPQNPSGKVFTLEEIERIAELCCRHDLVAISDEVYEHIVFDGRSHVTLLELPALRDRSIVVSSTAKTFSMTGWKVGTVVAAPRLTEAVRMCHQFLTYCTPAPLQEAMAIAIGMEDAYYGKLLDMYHAKRKKLCDALEKLGLDVLWPEGTYYAPVQIAGLPISDDLEFCRFLAREVGVAAVPASYFFDGRRRGRDLVRFCFCKRDETLDEAVRRLEQRLRWP